MFVIFFGIIFVFKFVLNFDFMSLITTKTYVFYYVMNRKPINKRIKIKSFDTSMFSLVSYNEPIEYLSNEKHYYEIMPKRLYLN